MAATRFTDHLLTGNHAGRPGASTVPQGTLYACSTHSLIYQSDGSSTWSTWATLGTGASGSITASGYTQSTARLLGRTTASTGAIEEITVGSGLSLSGGSLSASGGGLAGKQLTAMAGNIGTGAASGGFGWAANEAHIWPIEIAATMLCQGAYFDMSVAASGSYQWGLFDFSSSVTSMTKLVGGTGALNATGWQGIAVDAPGAAPQTVSPGFYLLIAKAPGSNMGEMRYVTQGSANYNGGCKNQTGYSWDDTPDASSGWSALNGVYRAQLRGRLDSSTQF